LQISILFIKVNLVNNNFVISLQDKYTCDIGDFGKFILLNELRKLNEGSIRLGVNWYYTNKAEKVSGDGRHLKYLNSQNPKNKNFEVCSPKLYFQLKKIVEANKRYIAEIEKDLVLPSETIFYSTPVRFHQTLPHSVVWTERIGF
jgi:hypothetical protein